MSRGLLAICALRPITGFPMGSPFSSSSSGPISSSAPLELPSSSESSFKASLLLAKTLAVARGAKAGLAVRRRARSICRCRSRSASLLRWLKCLAIVVTLLVGRGPILPGVLLDDFGANIGEGLLDAVFCSRCGTLSVDFGRASLSRPAESDSGRLSWAFLLVPATRIVARLLAVRERVSGAGLARSGTVSVLGTVKAVEALLSGDKRLLAVIGGVVRLFAGDFG